MMLAPDGLDVSTPVVAGEACPAELVDRWAPRVRMINAYGPTEGPIYATVSTPLPAASDPATRAVPIGAAVPHAAALLPAESVPPAQFGGVGDLPPPVPAHPQDT